MNETQNRETSKPTLTKLIATLCPDGVEYKTLGEIGTFTRGNGLQKKDFTNSGVPCIHYGQIYTYYGNFTEETKSFVSPDCAKNLRKAKKGDLIITTTSENLEDVCKCLVWLGDGEVCVGGETSIFSHNQNPKYIAYCLQTANFSDFKKKNFTGTKVIRVHQDKLKEFRVPVPPTEVQREIVRILDKFTELISLLEKERIMRKKQYEYYREKLFQPKNGWKHTNLLNLLSRPITDGPHTTPDFVSEGVPFVSVEAVWDGRIHFEKKRGYITEEFDEECCKKYKPQKHDVFMVKSGSTTGKVAYVDTDEKFNIWSPLAAMRVNEENSSRFLFHLLQTEKIQNLVRSRCSHGSQPNLSMRVIEQFEVDVPPLSEQKRIADILDRFDALCNDLSSGIPAEIAARKKQYEYYRDRLLTFREKTAAN